MPFQTQLVDVPSAYVIGAALSVIIGPSKSTVCPITAVGDPLAGYGPQTKVTVVAPAGATPDTETRCHVYAGGVDSVPLMAEPRAAFALSRHWMNGRLVVITEARTYAENEYVLPPTTGLTYYIPIS